MPDALLELGSLYESTRRLTEAAHAYKRLLLTCSRRRAPRHGDLAAGAHVYEARKLSLAAPDSYLDLQARFPKMRSEDGDREATVAELVAAELARPPYAQLVADRAQPPILLPLVRRWHWPAPLSHPIQLISALGVAPSVGCGRVVPGREGRPAPPRPVDRLAALVIRARGARRVGGLPVR